MPPDVTCPACQRSFAVPDSAEGPSACPRCGAALTRTEVRPAAGDIQARRPAPAALPTTQCLACGKAVPELCLLCPHCEEPLDERHRIPRAGDGKWRPLPERCLRPLALVGTVALLLSLAAALAPLTAGRRGAGPAAIGVFLLVLFLLMCLGAHLFDRVRTRTFQGWSHLVLEGLAGLGCLVTLGFAVLLFVGVVCAVLLR